METEAVDRRGPQAELAAELRPGALDEWSREADRRDQRAHDREKLADTREEQADERGAGLDGWEAGLRAWEDNRRGRSWLFIADTRAESRRLIDAAIEARSRSAETRKRCAAKSSRQVSEDRRDQADVDRKEDGP